MEETNWALVEKIEHMKDDIEGANYRSWWQRGVRDYAIDLLDELQDEAYAGRLDESVFSNSKTLQKKLLNGASDWGQYSYGGCALCYDGDIAKRLCTDSELKRTRNGELRPNRRETWLDVQARALYQAYMLIKKKGVNA